MNGNGLSSEVLDPLVDIKHRGKKIALTLIKYTYEFFEQNNVEWVISDVFEKNEPSRKMFENLGFEIFYHLELGQQQ